MPRLPGKCSLATMARWTHVWKSRSCPGASVLLSTTVTGSGVVCVAISVPPGQRPQSIPPTSWLRTALWFTSGPGVLELIPIQRNPSTSRRRKGNHTPLPELPLLRARGGVDVGEVDAAERKRLQPTSRGVTQRGCNGLPDAAHGGLPEALRPDRIQLKIGLVH